MQSQNADPSVVRALVMAGAGYAFVQAQGDFIVPDVTLHPVAWFPMRVTMHALWRGKSQKPLLMAALAALGHESRLCRPMSKREGA